MTKICPQKITSFRPLYIWGRGVMLFDYNIVRTHREQQQQTKSIPPPNPKQKKIELF